jgi:hypothetical protein
VVTLNTDAYIDDDAIVNARNDVIVTAKAKDSIVSVVAGAGGGTVGVAGTVGVTVLNTHTYANTGTDVTIAADNNVLVAARDDSKLILITGQAGRRLVASGRWRATATKDAQAYIGAGSIVDAKTLGAGISGIFTGDYQGSGFQTLGSFHGLAVQAASSEYVVGLAASVGGGFVGVAGGVGVTLVGPLPLPSSPKTRTSTAAAMHRSHERRGGRCGNDDHRCRRHRRRRWEWRGRRWGSGKPAAYLAGSVVRGGGRGRQRLVAEERANLCPEHRRRLRRRRGVGLGVDRGDAGDHDLQ